MSCEAAACETPVEDGGNGVSAQRSTVHLALLYCYVSADHAFEKPINWYDKMEREVRRIHVQVCTLKWLYHIGTTR